MMVQVSQQESDSATESSGLQVFIIMTGKAESQGKDREGFRTKITFFIVERKGRKERKEVDSILEPFVR